MTTFRYFRNFQHLGRNFEIFVEIFVKNLKFSLNGFLSITGLSSLFDFQPIENMQSTELFCAEILSDMDVDVESTYETPINSSRFQEWMGTIRFQVPLILDYVGHNTDLYGFLTMVDLAKFWNEFWDVVGGRHPSCAEIMTDEMIIERTTWARAFYATLEKFKPYGGQYNFVGVELSTGGKHMNWRAYENASSRNGLRRNISLYGQVVYWLHQYLGPWNAFCDCGCGHMVNLLHVQDLYGSCPFCAIGGDVVKMLGNHAMVELRMDTATTDENSVLPALYLEYQENMDEFLNWELSKFYHMKLNGGEFKTLHPNLDIVVLHDVCECGERYSGHVPITDSVARVSVTNPHRSMHSLVGMMRENDPHHSHIDEVSWISYLQRFASLYDILVQSMFLAWKTHFMFAHGLQRIPRETYVDYFMAHLP